MASNDTLIASISGIRGIVGQGLDPSVLVRYAGAFGTWCRERANAADRPSRVVVGRDARPSGDACAQIVIGTLRGMGCDVVDLGMASTPTVEMAVLQEQAAGGIVMSASHNPEEWNALKLLNEAGEFLTPAQGEAVIERAEAGEAAPATHAALGGYRSRNALPEHIDEILALDLIDLGRIAAQNLSVVVDGVNSVGGVALPRLLHRLGVAEENVHCLHCEPTGAFAHPAEPRPDHLTELTAAVPEHGADLGLAVDPDADRLALVDDRGRFMLEELTQVLAADFLWRHREGPFVTNLSSSRAIDDVAARHGQPVYRSAVGEINVVQRMKEVDAVLGGEGNGGVILPDLHYGRDALAGTALVLQHLADSGRSLGTLHDDLPHYAMAKDNLPLPDVAPDRLLAALAEKYSDTNQSTLDGLKINFDESWVHMRPSNTEPILRVYTEAPTQDDAQALADRFCGELREQIDALEAT
ncbi:phosphoglucosamine mutase [Salinibacter ruber]|uniref:phosphoglucosamine mutase n=1 Tax=Salinibacter ruber TaxID=146919 RepID=UPI00216A287E|nr:phosphoglucosamine mutase [Salinibacter ruber]MCS4100714.1 phosphomannomutase [Salinibacter ruber]